MYRSSPEALSLVTLGRADSKRVDTTCHGLTTAGKPCRKPLKKGSKDKYCHLHRDQEAAAGRKLVGAKTTTTTVVKEIGSKQNEAPLSRKPMMASNTQTTYGYITPSPSPSPSRKVSPSIKPLPQSILVPAQPARRPPSFQLSPPASISPPTPPLSITSSSASTPSPQPPKKVSFKLGKVFKKMFYHNSGKAKVVITTSPAYATSINTIRRNELSPTPYPRNITPTGIPSTVSLPEHTNSRKPVPKTNSDPLLQSSRTSPIVPRRPPAVAVQSRSTSQGVQRSWETMWVPGIDGIGAHIICKEWLSPGLSLVGRQKVLSCMRAPLSTGEEPGYIYVYKISESKENVFYKVGRTQNLTRRLYQWSRSCPYTPLLVEFFPSAPSSTTTSGPMRRSSSNSSISSLFKRDGSLEGKRPIAKCAVTHRVERLIHLELEDRFGRVDISPGGCSCGRLHKEWFRGGKKGETGWNEVRDVIVRWIGFARIAYGEMAL